MGQKDKLNELQGKLDEIFTGIDDYYSQSILDELINRIDATINDFNKDFKAMIGNLNQPSAKKTGTVRKKAPVKRTSASKRLGTAKKRSNASKAKSTKSRAKTLK